MFSDESSRDSRSFILTSASSMRLLVLLFAISIYFSWCALYLRNSDLFKVRCWVRPSSGSPSDISPWSVVEGSPAYLSSQGAVRRPSGGGGLFRCFFRFCLR